MHQFFPSPILGIYFLVYTDASAVGIGAILMQTDSAGKHHVIAIATRVLSVAEKTIQLLI